jgi:transcriptional regulator with XRE-family HTH domain
MTQQNSEISDVVVHTGESIGLKARVSKYNPYLRNRRMEMGMSQAAVAVMVGINYAKYNSIECVRWWPDILLQELIARVVKEEVETLFPLYLMEAVGLKIPTREVEADVMDLKHLLVPLEEAEKVHFIDEVFSGEAVVEQWDLERSVENALECLDEREKRIVCWFTGINCEAKTLWEIGMLERLTKTRIGQIKDKALLKLRRNDWTRDKGRLLGFLYEERSQLRTHPQYQ